MRLHERSIENELNRLRQWHEANRGKPVTDNILAMLVRNTIALPEFKKLEQTIPLGEFKRLLLAGEMPEVIDRFLASPEAPAKIRRKLLAGLRGDEGNCGAVRSK